jgi:exopolysaccharide biosynthesis polyprenyl glycosylphosphotransferase
MPRPVNRLRRTVLPLTLLAGDTLFAFAGLTLGWWLRYDSSLASLGLFVPNARFVHYLPLLLVGVALLVLSYAHLNLYDSRMLLRRYQSLSVIIKGTVFWLLTYLGVSLVLKFDPPISRLFVVLAGLACIALLYLWRTLFYAIVCHPTLRERLQLGAAILGWNDAAPPLVQELTLNPAHPFGLRGIITFPGDCPPPAGLVHLGEAAELDALLHRHPIDLLIATRLDLPREELGRITSACERAYVEWKVVPSAFGIFLSGLRLQTIGRLPVLGVEELTINRLFSRVFKRAFDFAGALVGLVVSAPVVLALAALVKRESPGGPVFFRQTRIGAGHRPFTLYKLRSMTPDAAATDAAHQSTGRADPRLLRRGAFLRRWNLDELPQFWNVLKGEMSLIGPRPERPYHVDRLAGVIPHYLPRHAIKPGMTGWAQVNGLRGNTSLEQRIQHDLYYIENWSPWLDLQILLLTLVRWRDPGAG